MSARTSGTTRTQASSHSRWRTGVSRTGLTETRFGGFHLSADLSRRLSLRSVEGFELSGWQVAERLVQTRVV